MSTLAMARVFFREAILDRVLNLVWLFALAMLGASLFLGDLSAGSQTKVIEDFGLGTINLLLVLVALMIGATAVHKEIDKRTAYVVLSKPVARWEFLLGKWVGLAAVLTLLMAAMGAAFYGLLWVITRHLDPIFVPAIGFMYLESLVVAAMALLFGCVTNPTLTSVYVLGLYLVGHNTESLRHFGDKMGAPAYMRVIGHILYYILPDLSTLNIKNQVVYGHGITLTTGLWAIAYAIGVIAVLLTLSTLAFARREI